MSKLVFSKIESDEKGIKIEIGLKYKESFDNQILPVYINNILRVYKVVSDEDKLNEFLEELKKNYSEVKNETFESIIIAGKPQLSDMDAFFEGESTKELVDYKIRNESKKIKRPTILDPIIFNNIYGTVDASIRHFPRLYIIIKKALKNELLSLKELYIYINNYHNKYYNGCINVEPNIYEQFIIEEDLKNLINKLYSCFKFERIEYFDLTDNKINIESSIEDIIKIKKMIELGRENGEVINDSKFKEMLTEKGISRKLI